MLKKEVTLSDIGKDIESLKERIDVIKKRRIDYGIDNILATSSVQQIQRTLLRNTIIEKQVDVVGFEDVFNTMKDQLDSEDPSLKVISIFGLGGLGKTALATKLYNSSMLRHFETRAKVCVSNEYNIIDILKRIIKSFMGAEHEKELSTMNEYDLLQYLSKLIEDRGRYLLLIDDIWDIQVWDQIKIAFPNQKNSSRIIITTRNKKVAEMVDDKCVVHQLRFLTQAESWQLFCKRAEPTSPSMEKLGKEMVGKCGGLPLAIVVLSGLLLHNMRYDYWLKVKEQLWTHLESDSFINEILSLSYNELSPQMGDCFLYLARYPEDHVIITDQLKLLWIAEEFIPEAEGAIMENLAEDYLKELLDRSLIQVNDLRLNGQVLSCRVHDLVRDLAINKAKEVKLLAIFDSKHHLDSIHWFKGQSRHVISNEIGEYSKILKRGFDASNLRSLALGKSFGGTYKLKEMELIFTQFKNLKVLDMTSVDSNLILKSNLIPAEIGDLVLLKYLGLMGNMSGENLKIPPSIGKLKKLQALVGSFTNPYIIPAEICKLHELRWIEIRTNGNGCLNIGEHQTKLHTLRDIQFADWLEIDATYMTNLHTLYIDEGYRARRRGSYDTDSEDEDGYKLDSVAKLTSLETFGLERDSSQAIPSMMPLSSCNRLKSVSLNGAIYWPPELCLLPDSVTDLTLIDSGFGSDPMPSLESLPNLTALYLHNVYKGNKIVCSNNAFPSLQILRLERFKDLEEFEAGDGTFPSLKRYQVRDCDKLQRIPQRLEGLLVPFL